MSSTLENQLNATVVSRIDVTPELMIMRVVPDQWELPSFEPGQFSVLGLPSSFARCTESEAEEISFPQEKMIKRAYSLASSSVAKAYFEFYISIVRSGSLTPRLFNLQRGQRVWLSNKTSGMFTLTNIEADTNVILAATGTGLAPYMSMVRSLLDNKNLARVAVLHGASHSWDLGYESELITLDRLWPAFSYVPIVSRPEQEHLPWSGHKGRIQDLWLRQVVQAKWGGPIKPENTHIFLCGNPFMTDEMVELLEKDGFSVHSRKNPGQIHVEKY